MEASDAFGQGVEIGDSEDPFAGTDFGDFGEDGPTPELKTVDREGKEVAAPAHAPADAASVESQEGEAAQPTGEADTPALQTEPAAVAETTRPHGGHDRSELERQEDAYQYKTQRGEPVSEELGAAHEEFERQKVQREAEAADERRQAEQQAAQTTGDPHAEQQARLRAVAEREAEEKRRAEEYDAPLDPTPHVESGGPTEDPTPASSGGQDVTDEPESAGEGEDEEAEPPAEPTDSSGKTTKRRYVILRVTGPGKFEQITWYEDKQGRMVAKGPGTKRQGIALARGAEDALKIGYVAAGAPPEGVLLVAVAQLHFQPKPVKPKPPEPSRVRLQIG